MKKKKRILLKNKLSNISKWTILSSTLIETIIAMTILSVVFFISISIILNSIWFSKTNLKLKAYELSSELLSNSISNSDFSDTEIQNDKLLIIQESEKISNDLIKLNLNVWYKDTILIYQTNRIIKIYE